VKIHQVLWSLVVHAAVHHDAQLACDSLRYNEPVQLGVQATNDDSANMISQITTKPTPYLEVVDQQFIQ